MSAPAADEVLRELGADHRQFRSVRQILFWVGEEMDRRMSPRSAALELASPRSAKEIADGIATLAAILWHLNDVRKQVDGRCCRHLFDWQIGWVQMDDALARDWGFRGFNEMRREMIHTENVLREVFAKRGLLPEET